MVGVHCNKRPSLSGSGGALGRPSRWWVCNAIRDQALVDLGVPLEDFRWWVCIAIRDQALVDLGVRLEDFRWWVCIAIRDQALVDLGVRLEDRPDGRCVLQ